MKAISSVDCYDCISYGLLKLIVNGLGPVVGKLTVEWIILLEDSVYKIDNGWGGQCDYPLKDTVKNVM